MKKFVFVFLLFPILSFAQKGFVITGNVAGTGDGEVKITSTQQDQQQLIAQAPLKNGSFTVKGEIPEPGLYFITIGKEQPQHIFLENTDIKISGSKKDIKNLKIEGSRSHQDFDAFRKTFNPLIGELSGKAALINRASDEAQRADLMQDYDSIGAIIQTEIDKFIAARPASYVSPFLLFVTAQINDDPMRMEQRYNALDSGVRTSNVGKSLANFIDYSKVGAIGTNALDFTQNDVDGKPVSLSQFKGKYVLLDFWASWCRPCRAENPNVVTAFQKFKDKNFTILSVSLDRERDAWVSAIKKDGLQWTQVSDLQFWNNAVAAEYRVQAIPQNFLIDPNGKIVAKNLRGAELDAKLCALLGCN